MGLERGRKGRHQRLQLLDCQAGQIQPFCRAPLDVGESSSAHGCRLLSSEAQESINRDELYYAETVPESELDGPRYKYAEE